MSDPISHTASPGGLRGWLISPQFPALVATLGCLPLLVVHFQQLWVRPHCQYFPLVLTAVVILYLLRRTDSDPEPAWPRPWLAGLALLAGFCLTTYAVLRISPLLCFAAWLLSMLVFVARTPVKSWSAWALLLLLLRLPQGRDVTLIQWLQKVTTRISSGVLDQLGIDHIREGNVLTLPDHKLFVEQACSGVVSLFTIVATAAIFGAFLRRSLFHTLLLMAAGAFWAGAANILRVVAIALFLEKMQIDLTSGWRHDVLGLAVFCVTLCTLFSTDGLLRFLFGPMALGASDTPESIHDNPLVTVWNGLFWPPHERPIGLLSERVKPPTHRAGTGWVLLVLVCSTGFLSLGALQVWGGIGPFSAGLGIGQKIDDLTKESLPPEMAGWTLTDFRRENRSVSLELGERSRQWTYRQGNLEAVASIDYPFPDWHHLEACYRGVGWTLGESAPLPDSSTALQYPLHNEQMSGKLIFDLFDQNGEAYHPPSGQGIHPRWRRLFSGESSRWTLPTFYQVQVLAVAPTVEPLDSHTSADLQQLFLEFRRTIRQQATPSQAGGQP